MATPSAPSRIFVRGLPPSISDEDFKSHFSKRFNVTDSRLLAHRRIGYVGFKTPEDAAKAIKYFNKSFIRMSKITVEIADNNIAPRPNHPTARQSAIDTTYISPRDDEAATNPLKRKRTELEQKKNPKLDEYLGLMTAPSKLKTWRDGEPIPEQSIENPDADSAVPSLEVVEPEIKKVALTKDKLPDPPPQSTPTKIDADDDVSEDIMSNVMPASDMDWMRSKTSRLLGLVEDDDNEDAGEWTVRQDSPALVKGGAAESKLAEAVEDTGVAQSLPAEEAEATSPADTENASADVVAIRKSGRLFLRNLAYTIKEEELRYHFSPFGALEEVHLPLDIKTGEPKGFAFVQFDDHDQAVQAFEQFDGTVFQGRLLHIIAGSEKRENKLNDFEISKLPLKKQKQIQRKSGAASSTFNWNSLYMNPDAVRSSIAARLGMSKSEVFDPTSSEAAVKQAQAETHIIQETKSFFASNGVDLDAFQSRDRGDTTILVKNFPYGTTSDEIRKLFEETAQVSRVLMPPSGTIAIVELAQVPQARAAFSSLAYRKFKDSILFLEKGPKNLFKGTAGLMQPVDAGPAAINKPSTVDLRNQETQDVDTTTLFVRNLNFTTTNERFTDTFKPLDGFVSARIKTKPDAKQLGRTLSMGFGFLEFRSKEQAKAALAAMDGQTLDGHALVIKASHKGLDAAEERRKEDQAKKTRDRKSKLIIKNLPFEATKKDVQNLFKSYGQLRAVRLPKKFDNSRKGYAFAEFMTPKEAENAMDALRNTHLLGRRLAIDYAAGDADDAEKEIERMQQKVGRQVNNLALKKLTTASERKKFNIDGGDAEEDIL